MKSWRDRLRMNPEEIKELSAESMAVTRIMRGLGASPKDIGKLCQRFGLEYNEDESTFSRAVNILRSVYSEMSFVNFVDVKTGKKEQDIYDDLLGSPTTGILFFRKEGTQNMSAFIKGRGLMSGPLGPLVIQPGIRYIAKRDGIELWEQDPVILVKSFSRKDEI